MKVISLQIGEKRLVKKALHKDRGAQKKLYDHYSPKMLSICRMYVKDVHSAEDVMLKGFFKVFKNLKKFRNEGSFEGWVRKIMVREALDFLRSQNRHGFTEEFKEEFSPVVFSGSEEVDELQHQIDQLPQGYKTVLVLYAVEGYKHHEIAQLMNISEGTSKSQLSKARKMLKEKLEKKIQKNENRNIR